MFIRARATFNRYPDREAIEEIVSGIVRGMSAPDDAPWGTKAFDALHSFCTSMMRMHGVPVPADLDALILEMCWFHERPLAPDLAARLGELIDVEPDKPSTKVA